MLPSAQGRRRGVTAASGSRSGNTLSEVRMSFRVARLVRACGSPVCTPDRCPPLAALSQSKRIHITCLEIPSRDSASGMKLHCRNGIGQLTTRFTSQCIREAFRLDKWELYV